MGIETQGTKDTGPEDVYSRVKLKLSELSEFLDERRYKTLCNKKSLTDDEMAYVIDYANNNRSGILCLNKLTILSDKQARELSKTEHTLYLGINVLNDTQAKELSKIPRLVLDKIETLTDDQTDFLLGGGKKVLSLNGLTRITDRQAEILGQKVEELLNLRGLRKITDNQANSLNKQVQFLNIRKSILTKAQREILQKHIS